MYKYRKIISIAAAMLILFGALAMSVPKHIQAESPGVYIMPGNPDCQDLAQGYTTKGSSPVFIVPILEPTAIYGFKLDGIPPLGKNTYPLTSAFGSLTGGAPQDPNNSVTVEGLSNYDFNWWATLGIDAVIVKNASEADVYVYTPEAFFGGPLTSGENAISHIEFCYDYELLASKTAEAKTYKTIDWTITKDVDPASAARFVGEDATFDYTVSVTKGETFGPWVVEGFITVKNPTPWPVDFEITDEVAGVPAKVDCGGVTTLTANDGLVGGTDEVVCTYVLSSQTELQDGKNVATITSLTEGVGNFLADADFAFGDPILSANSEPESITVDDTNDESWTTGVSATWNYSETQTCSTNTALYGVYGFYSTDYNNTAKINETTGDSDSEKVTLTCYAPVLDKDASTNWEKKYDWTITKGLNGDYEGFIGDDAFNHGYVVSVDQTVTDQNFKVFGKIYVTNPADSPGNMTVSLVDKLDDLTSATVDCGEGATSVTVAPGATESCDYSGYLAAKTDGTNIATGTFNKIDFTTTETFAFGEPTIVGFPTINVIDDDYGALGSASGDKTFDTYYKSFQCSGTPGDYKDGIWTMDQFINTATIDETGQKDTAKVDLTCYAPVITKDATATYDERHIWDVDKTVDPKSQGGFAGDVLPWKWTVTVSETFLDENFLVTGKIYVKNPAGSPGDMAVSLVDRLDDGTFATVDCGSGATSITVAQGATGTCDYTAIPVGRTATLNTATGSFNGLSFVGIAPVSFTKNVVNGTATVTDNEIGLNKELTAGLGSWTYIKDYSHTCSSDRADYFVDGVYTQGKWSITNWAYVYSGGVEQDKDDAATEYTCDAGFMDLLKYTDGMVDPTKDWQFALYLGPDGFGTTPIATDSTLNDVDGLLDFDSPALRPDTTYTICELGVPVGYTSVWYLDGSQIYPYNPDAPLENLGNICHDFKPSIGTTISFTVDNTSAYGDPRTPGYWKNWNTCTGGGQQFTAAANGGWEEGFWLLDDVLVDGHSSAYAGGITWDDILVDDFVFPINSCELGVSILNTRDFISGKQSAGDAGYNLAKHLLAAQLNFAAGACIPPLERVDIEDIADQAETLLDKIDFDAVGVGIDKKDKKTAA